LQGKDGNDEVGSEPSPFSDGDRDLIRALMLDLPDDDRELLLMVYWDGLSIDEVSRIEDCSWNDAYFRLRTLLGDLRIRCEADPRFSRYHITHANDSCSEDVRQQLSGE
jgi:DNA-directed RNA polymerase specialized sigma24 family protein